MAWVEEGIAPDSIIASSYKDNNKRLGVVRETRLCPYPARSVFLGATPPRPSISSVVRPRLPFELVFSFNLISLVYSYPSCIATWTPFGARRELACLEKAKARGRETCQESGDATRFHLTAHNLPRAQTVSNNVPQGHLPLPTVHLLNLEQHDVELELTSKLPCHC